MFTYFVYLFSILRLYTFFSIFLIFSLYIFLVYILFSILLCSIFSLFVVVINSSIFFQLSRLTSRHPPQHIADDDDDQDGSGVSLALPKGRLETLEQSPPVEEVRQHLASRDLFSLGALALV